MLSDCLKILIAKCQIDGYVHQPFGDVFCIGLIHKRHLCYISVHSVNRRLSFRTYIVSNMTKSILYAVSLQKTIAIQWWRTIK